MSICKSKCCKVTSCQILRLEKTFCHLARVRRRPGFNSQTMGSSSKFDGLPYAPLWSTETYSTSLERYKPLLKHTSNLLDWKHFLDAFCSLIYKGLIYYLVNHMLCFDHICILERAKIVRASPEMETPIMNYTLEKQLFTQKLWHCANKIMTKRSIIWSWGCCAHLWENIGTTKPWK